MKRHMRALALCLCLLLMLPVFSGAAAQAQDSGLVLSKSSEYDATSQTVRLTLEAYTTGQIVTERVSTPCDVALVLDESGSMAYSIGTTPVYAPALETDKTYYLVTDSGGSQAVTYQSGAWGYTSWGTRYTVQPTTGPDDPDGSHTQLYAGAQTRKAAIIAAVNAFLTQMEAENANLTADVTPPRGHRRLFLRKRCSHHPPAFHGSGRGFRRYAEHQRRHVYQQGAGAGRRTL